MRSILTRLNKSEFELITENCNFTEDERIVFNMTVVGKSDMQIADKLSVSTSTVTRRKRAMFGKIKDLVEVLDNMTTIYVNGKRITKDELSNYEIQIDKVKKILKEKLTKGN